MVNDEEQVSALVDDELDGRELSTLIGKMRGNLELTGRWQRYHLISDTLHNNLPPVVSLDLTARVAAALEREPTVLAPPPRRFQEIGKRAVGVALAASVSAAAILTLQRLNAPEPGVATLAGAPESQRLAGQSRPAPDPRLSPYLVNHNEYSVSSGMHGVLPYARIVGEQARR